MVGLHMTGTALSWIQGLLRNNLITTWSRLFEDLRERFGSDMFEDKLEDLTRLRQTSTMDEYIYRFEALLNEVDSQDEKALITYFGGGLTDDLRQQLKINRPRTLHEAFATAKVYEAHLDRSSYTFRSGMRQTSDPHRFRTAPTLLLSAVSPKEPIIKVLPAGGQQITTLRRGPTTEE